MLDILEIVFSQGAVSVPALEQDMRPVGGAGIFEQQEGLYRLERIRYFNEPLFVVERGHPYLPADRSTAGNTGTVGPVEFDGALKVFEAGAVLEGGLPSRPAAWFCESRESSSFVRTQEARGERGLKGSFACVATLTWTHQGPSSRC